MPTDSKTTVAELRNVVREFVRERDWEQFHSPKNLSMSLSIEVAELMEHFQWISADESRSPDDGKLVEIGEEMADVLCYLLALSETLKLDLSTAVFRKMELNRRKYPVAEFRGRYGQDDPQPAGTQKLAPEN
jgi:NTP pyrophosphatase (non-canonical NTP hydrolase)